MDLQFTNLIFHGLDVGFIFFMVYWMLKFHKTYIIVLDRNNRLWRDYCKVHDLEFQTLEMD